MGWAGQQIAQNSREKRSDARKRLAALRLVQAELIEASALYTEAVKRDRWWTAKEAPTTHAWIEHRVILAIFLEKESDWVDVCRAYVRIDLDLGAGAATPGGSLCAYGQKLVENRETIEKAKELLTKILLAS